MTGALAAVCVLLGAAGPTRAQLSAPDTTAPQRPALPTVEPERVPRRITGVQRVVAVRYPTQQQGEDLFSAAVPELVDFVSAAVNLDGTRFVAGEHSLADPAVDDALVLFLTGNRATLEIPPGQRARLGRYLRAGGLLYAEDVRSLVPGDAHGDVAVSGTPFDRQLKALLADSLVLGAAGRRWRTVPEDHPLFHAYFRFPHGPPQVAASRRGSTEPRVTELEMLGYRGRLAVLFSELNISTAWAYPEAVGRRRALMFGANLLVHALAQYAAADLGVRR